MPEKPTNRDTVVSDFLREKIREWIKGGREQREIATAGKLSSPSVVAMVKKGQGAGAKTLPGFALAFGYASVDALVDAAYEWRRGLGESLERRLEDPAFRAGLNAVGLIMPPPTEVETRTIAGDFVSPRFDNREPQWWAVTLGTELAWDRKHSMDPDRRAAHEGQIGEWMSKRRARGHRSKAEKRAEAHGAQARKAATPASVPIEPKKRVAT